jgi:hypothetical protein
MAFNHIGQTFSIPLTGPNDLKKQNLLLLTKIFFTTDFYPNIDDIIEFLELSPEEVMLLISKILTHQKSDDSYHNNLINSIGLNLIEKKRMRNNSLSSQKRFLHSSKSRHNH